MIICVCHRLNCKDVAEAIDSGARSPNQIQAHHGNKFQCGKCAGEMCARLREKQASLCDFEDKSLAVPA